jgi:hypothetical protein
VYFFVCGGHRRIRVGFLTAFPYRSSVSKRFARILSGLSKALFHVTLLTFGSDSSPILDDALFEELR